MNFHLSFSVTPFEQKIDYTQKCLFIGSCFAENIGEMMQKYKLTTLVNPHGVLYNPSSIAAALNRYISNTPLQEQELFYANECWNSWEHHSRLSGINKNECLATINKSISTAHTFIKKAEWLFITFGSAYVYQHNRNGHLVGNCHKVPQKEFTKLLLDTVPIVEEYVQLIQNLKNINPNLKIIFTVSPVRYIRDGITENTLSKARLIEAVHQLVQSTDNTYYFPAYELIMDDLRDYRFYKADLVHPNEQAIAYVFDKLMHSTLSEETKILYEKVKSIVNATQHKPFNEATEAYKKFKQSFLEKCLLLEHKYPYLNFKEEINYFSK